MKVKFLNKWPKKKKKKKRSNSQHFVAFSPPMYVFLKFYPVSIFEVSNNSRNSRAFVLPTWLKFGEWVFAFFLKFSQQGNKMSLDCKDKIPAKDNLQLRSSKAKLFRMKSKWWKEGGGGRKERKERRREGGKEGPMLIWLEHALRSTISPRSKCQHRLDVTNLSSWHKLPFAYRAPTWDLHTVTVN